MDAQAGSPARRRMLARRLRELREQAGMTMEAAAPKLYWSVSKLSRIENYDQLVDVHAVKSMLDLYGAGGDVWDELTKLALECRGRGWWRAYGIGDNSYIGFEAEASRVQEVAVGFVPGLLQIAPYSQALFVSSPVPRTPAAVEREVAVRMRRQLRLTAAEDGLHLVAIVAEAALHNPIGGPAVLREQLDHLLITSELDNVDLHVLPTAVGAHPASASGFFILSFGDLGEPDIVYVEHALGAVQLEKEEVVELARLKFDQLQSLALDPVASQALIERAAEQT